MRPNGAAQWRLASFPVELMRPTTRAKLLQLDSTGVVAPVFFSRVIPLAANRALERDHVPVGLRLLGHCTSSSNSNFVGGATKEPRFHKEIPPENATP
jgi:hypothetical protein